MNLEKPTIQYSFVQRTDLQAQGEGMTKMNKYHYGKSLKNPLMIL